MQLNNAIRAELREQGSLGKTSFQLPILVGRDITVADTTRASSYRVGDTLQYRSGNKEVGVKAGQYATILARNTDANKLTVKTQDGRIVIYDPARASGVNTFETRIQEFSPGERVQFLGKDKKLGTNTRDTGTLRAIDAQGNAELVLDRKSRVLKFNLPEHRQIDHAYSMTSHSAQSKTVDRVLINVNSSDPRLRGLLNEVFAYVAASRPEHDIQVFADDATQLFRVLHRPNETEKAHSSEPLAHYQKQLIQQPEKQVEKSSKQDLGIHV